MKPPARDLDRFIDRLPDTLQAVLLYGPDQGLVSERRASVLSQWLDAPDDPLAITALTADEVRQDPARLGDETRAFSMLGGRRAVRVTDAADAVTKAVAAALEAAPLEAKLIVEARELQASSSLRKLFEQKPDAAAVPCYRAEGTELRALIERRLHDLGRSYEHDAVDYLAAHSGADRAVLTRELEKLDLYLGDRAELRVEDVMACIGDGAVLEIDALLHATAGGRVDAALIALDRLLAAKQTPVAIIRSLTSHYRRLWGLAIDVAVGEPAKAVIDRARPPIFFRAKPAFARALERRSAAALRQDVTALVRAERQCKTTGLPAHLICRDLVLHLAAAT